MYTLMVLSETFDHRCDVLVWSVYPACGKLGVQIMAAIYQIC